MSFGLQKLSAAASIFVAAVFISGAAGKPSFAPEAVPAVRTFPRAVTLGGRGELEVQIEMPARAGTPKLSTLAGGTLSAPKQEEDLWIARYKPPAVSSPGYDVILAETKTGAVGVAVVSWIAKAKLPVTVQKANATITVKVGGREFGPVAAGANETVPVDVEIPPGAREVEVTATAPGSEPLHTSEPLAVPPLERVFASVPSTGKAGKKSDATIVLLDRDGLPTRQAPAIAATNAKLESIAEIGPGVWRASLTPSGGALAMTVRGDGARAKFSMKVPAAKAQETPPPPLPMETMPPMSGLSPAPTCESLHLKPGEITTARQLKERIAQAGAVADLTARRDGLIGIGCRFPDEHAVQLQLAATDLLLGDNEGAIAVVTPLLADETEIHEEHRALGYSYRASAELRLGKLDLAADDARAAETQMPGLYMATYVLGEALFLKKDFPGASAALLSAYRTAPNFASAIDHEMLAELLERRGDLAESAEHRLAVAKLDPNDIAGWRHAAKACEISKSWARAHEAWTMLGAGALPGMGNANEARAGAATAKAAAPKDLEIGFVDAAIEADHARNASKAIFLLDKALKSNPKNLAARFYLAHALFASGAVNRATLEIGSVLNEAPHWAPALILSGDIERQKGDKIKAAARYREAATLTPAPALATVARWRLDELTPK